MLKKIRKAIDRFAVLETAAYIVISAGVTFGAVVGVVWFAMGGMIALAVISGVVAVAGIGEVVYIAVNDKRLQKEAPKIRRDAYLKKLEATVF